MGVRAVVYLRRRTGVSGRQFRRAITKELVPALSGVGGLTELRIQAFLPWNSKRWNTPDVAHDNPADQRTQLSQTLAPVASAIHGYDGATLTYIENGETLSTIRSE